MLVNFLPLEITVVNEIIYTNLIYSSQNQRNIGKSLGFFLIFVSELPLKYLFRNMKAYSSYVRPEIHEGKLSNLN